MSKFDDVTLNTTEEKGSYGIGLQIGQQLLDSQMNVKIEAVARGINDALSGQQAIIELSEISQALDQMQKQAAALQQELIKENQEKSQAYLDENKKKDGVQVTASGLQYEILKEGNGPVPVKKDKVSVHYTGELIDGTVFDSSITRGQPIEFPVTGVISGWIEALTMMPVGSKWRLVIPYNLAYGERGAGAAIPPMSTLIFELELLDILS